MRDAACRPVRNLSGWEHWGSQRSEHCWHRSNRFENCSFLARMPEGLANEVKYDEGSIVGTSVLRTSIKKVASGSTCGKARQGEGLEAINRTELTWSCRLQCPRQWIEVLKSCGRIRSQRLQYSFLLEWWARRQGGRSNGSLKIQTPGPVSVRMSDKMIPPSAKTKEDDLSSIDLKQRALSDSRKARYPHRFAIYAEKFGAHDFTDSEWRFIESTFQTQVDRYRRYKIEREQTLVEDTNKQAHRGTKKNRATHPSLPRRHGQ